MFGRSELLGLLQTITGEILVPNVVFAECTDIRPRPGASRLMDAAVAGVIRVESDLTVPKIPELADITSLHAGEIAALNLARHLGCPVLMDDALGRKVAVRQGVAVIGSAGILLAAKERGLVDQISPILTMWASWGYFLAPSLLDAVLFRASERQ